MNKTDSPGVNFIHRTLKRKRKKEKIKKQTKTIENKKLQNFLLFASLSDLTRFRRAFVETTNNDNYYSTIAPFFYIRAKERAKCATLLRCRTGQKYGLKAERQNGRSKLSGIINPSFDGLTYNTSGHFAQCCTFPRPFGSRKTTTQLAKYPRVPLISRVRGPYCKIRTEFFPVDLWPKREARGP